MPLHSLPVHELRHLLVQKEIKVSEVVQAYLDRVETLNVKINAYVTVMGESALKEAGLYDEGRKDLNASPLAGVPLAIKDVLCLRGTRTTCGSKMLENFVPPYDATVIEWMKSAGAVFLGKTNLDEFAMGSSNENSAFGPTRNPWNLSKVSGGSSGGSAAAVAAGLCSAALGTDTGGSIRQPASFCGVVGLKPTYGRVSRYGLVAFASSLDQVGPIARDVEDAALLLQTMAGYDSRDTTCVDLPVPDYMGGLKKSIGGMKLGIPKEYLIDGIHPDVALSMEKAIETFRTLGAETVEVSLPHTHYGVAAYYIIAPAEASSNLARYDGVKYGHRSTDARDLLSLYRRSRSEGFGAEVKRRIMLGTYALSAGYYDAYYKKASQVRTLIRNDFLKAFEKCDAIIAPVAPIPPFDIGEKVDDPLQMYLSDIFTLPASLAGIPGISVPCGFSGEHLPIGLQILGPHFAEESILRLAHHFERATDHHPGRPPVE